MSDYCLYPNQCGIGMDCSECMDGEITRLKAERDELRARVAELESAGRKMFWAIRTSSHRDDQAEDAADEWVLASGLEKSGGG